VRIGSALSIVLGCALVSSGAAIARNRTPPPSADGGGVVRELGLPYPSFPPDNPPRQAVIALGRKLFFDKRLSRQNSVSCATCHDPQYGFADPHPVSVGSEGRSGQRNSPSVLNSAFTDLLMWDGKGRTLEEQTLFPFESHVELDLPVNEAVAKLARQGYSDEFRAAFGRDVDDLVKALSTYERTLLAGDSPFDRFLFGKDEHAIPAAARRGFATFLRVKCDQCHLIMTPGIHPFGLKMALFTDNKFHNLGVGTEEKEPDPGRYALTGVATEWAAFKTPSLRNVALTAPYFHDGSKATLMEVIEFYDRGGTPNPYLDQAIRPLSLTPEDKQDLVAFLVSLTSHSIGRYANEESKIGVRVRANPASARDRSP
jgi:cytochrome c peroxidase